MVSQVFVLQNLADHLGQVVKHHDIKKGGAATQLRVCIDQ